MRGVGIVLRVELLRQQQLLLLLLVVVVVVVSLPLGPLPLLLW